MIKGAFAASLMALANAQTYYTADNYTGALISLPVSVSEALCFQQNGYDSSITRVFYDGHLDNRYCDNLNTLMGGGVAYRDGLLQPSFYYGSPRAQVEATVNGLRTNCQGAWSGTLWLDATAQDYTFAPVPVDNQYFLQQLLMACDEFDITCGIYTNMADWTTLMGSASYKGAQNRRLWYLSTDGNANFNDFESFGGWTSAAVWGKTYNAANSFCGVTVQQVYIPSQE